MKFVLIIGLVSLAVVAGVGLWATNFHVYLGDDPTTCNNCHVMDAVYEGWYHAGHREAAVCTECHTPHSFIPKYLYKGKSGMNHVTMFTLGHIPEPLRAKPDTHRIVQANCIRCHTETISAVADGAVMNAAVDDGRYCFECHREVGHGPRGITILPYQDIGLYESRDYQPSH